VSVAVGLASFGSSSSACASTGSAQSTSTKAAVEPSAVEASEPKADALVDVGGAKLSVFLDGDAGTATDAVLVGWVKRSAEIVTRYCAKFPVPDFVITLHRGGGDDIGYGEHQGGRFIDVWIGRDVNQATLDDDWVMVHEMLHAAMPELPDGHKWMQEGLSTFAEPIAKAQFGAATAENIWDSWREMMPVGRPGFYDGGLDETDTWARRYWGGALFWFVSDVRIRRATNNAKSVRDCVRFLVGQGANSRVEWQPKRVAAACDEATGTDVMKSLYSSLAEAPGDIDTDKLFAELGVTRVDKDHVKLDDAAPLASIRRAMTQP
jgi:hypothetical protein